MVVCQFYLRGQCKFGDSCRNEHPPQGAGGFGATSWNRPSTASTAKTDLPYNAANISQDLNPKGEKPIWPLSSYAPFKHETTLIGGLDVSPEELRVKAVEAVRAGNVNEYIQHEARQIAAADQVFNTARTNMSQIFEQAAKQSKLVANSTTTTSAFSSTSSAFNPAPTSTPSSFGNITTFGNDATPSSFNTPALGAQANSASAFGQPASGQAGFGQPAFGQPGFGQTGTTSAFGQPKSGQPSSVPGDPQASTASTTSAFGQPSFGQTNSLAGSGSSSLIRPATGAFSAFAGTGPSVFGTGSTPSSTSSGGTGGGFSAFAGQPAAFGSAASSNFGQPPSQPAGTTPTFGQPQQPTGNAFSALTASSNNAGSIFGSFGAPALATETTTATTAQPVSAFGGVPSQQSAFGNVNPSQQQPVSAFARLGQTTSNLAVSPSGLIPSVSMSSSNSGGSPFPASPMSTINPTGGKQSSMTSPSSQSIDFASLISRTTYRPGSTPYDSQLPQNYSAILPEKVNKAFRKERFTWAWEDSEAAMPEWVPPVDVR